MRNLIISSLLVLSALTVNAQSNIYSRIIVHSTDNIMCYAIEYGFHNDFMLTGEENIIRIDSTGQIISSFIIGNNYCLKTINRTPDSCYVFFGESTDTSTQFKNLLMLKTDTLGNTLFAKEFSIGKIVSITSADICPDSGFVVCGAVYEQLSKIKSLVFRFDKNGNIIWKKMLDAGVANYVATEVKQICGANYVVAGSIYTDYFIATNAALVKLDTSGNVIYSSLIETIPATYRSKGFGLITVDSLIYCLFTDDSQISIAKIDCDNNIKWCYSYQGYMGWEAYLYENHPVKMHLSLDSTIYYGALSEIDTSGTPFYYWTVDVQSRTDMLETKDKGSLIVGIGPVIGCKNTETIYQTHLGIVKADSIGNTENCAYLYPNTDKDTLEIEMLPVFLSDTIPSVSINEVPIFEIIPYVLYSDYGCVDFTGGIHSKSEKPTPGIFPNPSYGNITIKFPDSPQIISEVKVIDILGNQRFSKSDINNVSLDINLGFLPSGVYVIKVTNKNKEDYFKSIIIEGN